MLDELEKEILKALNENARQSFRQLAKKLNISPTTLHHRVKRLESLKVLKGYIPLIEREAVGFNLMAIIGLRVHQEKDSVVQKEISRFPQVAAIYEVTGDWDLVLVCNFKGPKDLTYFLKKKLPLANISRVITHIVLKIVKEEKRIPIF